MPSWPTLLVVIARRGQRLEEAGHRHVHLPRTGRFSLIWLSGILGSLVVTAALLIAQYGWHTFWHRIGERHIDPGAYDLLVATIIGAVGVFLALWFSSVVAIAAFEQTANLQHVAYRLSSPWTFGPICYFGTVTNLLLAAAWGVGRSWVGLVFLPTGGTVALFCLIQMTRVALSPVPDAASADSRT